MMEALGSGASGDFKIDSFYVVSRRVVVAL
jgi:hypothetical protein